MTRDDEGDGPPGRTIVHDVVDGQAGPEDLLTCSVCRRVISLLDDTVSRLDAAGNVVEYHAACWLTINQGR